MIKFGVMIALMNMAGIAYAALGYLCIRDGHPYFAAGFMVMSIFTVAAPRGSLSLSTEKKEDDKNDGTKVA